MKNQEIKIGGRKKVLPNEVMLLVADTNYTILHCENGTKYLVATTLKQLEKRFSETKYFFRSHKSFLINLHFIESFEEKLSIKMKNDIRVLVSRRKRAKLIEEMSNI